MELLLTTYIMKQSEHEMLLVFAAWLGFNSHAIYTLALAMQQWPRKTQLPVLIYCVCVH